MIQKLKTINAACDFGCAFDVFVLLMVWWTHHSMAPELLPVRSMTAAGCTWRISSFITSRCECRPPSPESSDPNYGYKYGNLENWKMCLVDTLSLFQWKSIRNTNHTHVAFTLTNWILIIWIDFVCRTGNFAWQKDHFHLKRENIHISLHNLWRVCNEQCTYLSQVNGFSVDITFCVLFKL